MKNLMKAVCLLVVLPCIAFQQAFSQDIYTAVADGNVEMVRQFLEKDPGLLNLKNQDLLSPLNLAAERGQFEVAALLLKMGADPSIGDNENSQPIHLAAISGSIPILDLLLEKGVDIDTRDFNQKFHGISPSIGSSGVQRCKSLVSACIYFGSFAHQQSHDLHIAIYS